ncbi:hypothetical protein BCD67_12820 [Oscillatoriales cyanobacterium USR001]|nr:hypothetical protein BCD67_12820 [Oscillatoriales cyanobacterium USR001]
MTKTAVIENPNKTKDVRFLGPVDISSIKDDIINLSQEYWDTYDNIKPNKFGEFKKTTEHIVFRFVSDFHQAFPDILEYPVWSEWKHKLEPVIRSVVAQYGYKEDCIGKVMLAKLKAGAEIKKHKDSALENVYPHKIHIPITTNTETPFFVGDRKYHFEVGQAYEIDNIDIHGTINGGDTDRIHLLFTYYDRPMNEIKVADPEANAQELEQEILKSGIYYYDRELNETMTEQETAIAN